MIEGIIVFLCIYGLGMWFLDGCPLGTITIDKDDLQ